ncbi:hypothetical protein PG994_005126 [Apiospora phragmitis]|uniref:Uncharacterized protein n=1 Tax=Apiospora phragmitis TaxID=2905665 RepID=A0ABR1VTT3_9PEZI
MVSSVMENRHMAVTSRPFANSKARRAEKDIPGWALAPKRNNSKKDASSTNRTRDNSQEQKQLQRPRQSARGSPATVNRRSCRLRSPSLPCATEAYDDCRRGSDDDHPKTANPIATTMRRSTAGDASEEAAVAVKALLKSNEALLDLVTELIRLVPVHFPVHEMIQRREEARVLADDAPPSTAIVGMRWPRYSNMATTTMTKTPVIPLEEDAEKEEVRKPKFVKGHHPRSKSSVF